MHPCKRSAANGMHDITICKKKWHVSEHQSNILCDSALVHRACHVGTALNALQHHRVTMPSHNHIVML